MDLVVAALIIGAALFEALSAVTTTGLTTLSSMETRPAPFLFARAWVQWVGGLGIVVLTVTMMLKRGRPRRSSDSPSAR